MENEGENEIQKEIEVMRGYSQLLKGKTLTKERRRELVEKLSTMAEDLSDILEQEEWEERVLPLLMNTGAMATFPVDAPSVPGYIDPKDLSGGK